MNIIKINKIAAVMLAVFIAGIFADAAYALPNNSTVAAGSTAITRPDGHTMHINQTTNKAIINWRGYSIGANETVKYFQPGSGSISLNRVTGADPSLIYGRLSANGQVWVINPNGMLIGKNAAINVGGFLGSTLNISNNNFLSGNYNFAANEESLASITNDGNIKAAGGYAVFIAPTITNQGSINAANGSAAMASGSDVTLTFTNNSLINLVVNKAAAADALGIDNSGKITADGGEVLISAKVAGDVLKTVVNNSGIIQARTIEEKNGVIKLLGGMKNNAVKVGGTLDASAPNGGNGGFIETSAAKVKTIDGTVITTKAPYGASGTWLIDPNDFTIAADKTGTVSNGTPSGDISGATLGTALNLGNVTILSSQGSRTAGNGDIFVNDTVSWSANTLTLSAFRNIEINQAMTGSGSASLALLYGQGAAALGNTATYSVNDPVSLLAGNNFSTKLGSNGSTISYTVITALGSEGSTTGTDLQGMSGNLAGYYALGANIDATLTSRWNSRVGFQPIGDSTIEFTGKFDGLGHTITGPTINRPSTDYVGLFGATGSGADIRNVGLTIGSVSGDHYVGGLVGWNSGSITDSYNSGSVTGTIAVGGLVGWNSGSITDSYNSGSVTGTIAVGGLAGFNSLYASITDSYNSGSVTGTSDFIGGLAGYSRGSITDSYWDTETSGQATSVGGGAGETTAEMKTLFTFSTWDIDDTGGTGKVWRIYNGDTYPLLRHFLISATITSVNSGSKTYDRTAYSGGKGYYTIPGANSSDIFYGGLAQNAVNAGTYGLTVYSKQNGYDLTGTRTATLIINKKSLTITGITADNKVYDAATTAAVNSAGAVYTGLLSGDKVTVSATGAFADKNVGAGKTVTLTSTDGGTDAGNYSISNQASTTADITAKSLTITGLTADNKVYDAATTATLSGTAVVTPIGSDTVTLGGTAAGTFADKNAGTGKTVTETGLTISGGADAGNYTLVQQTGLTADITKADLSITGLTADNKVYDAATAATLSGTAVVTPIGSDTVTLGGTAAGTFADKNAGTGKTVTETGLTISGTDAGNYSLADDSLSADITAKSLTITADDKSKMYGEANPIFTATYAGFKNSETPSVVSGLSLSTTATTTTGIGTAIITVSGAISPNYTITEYNGTLTITPAPHSNYHFIREATQKSFPSYFANIFLPQTGSISGGHQRFITNHLSPKYPCLAISEKNGGDIIVRVDCE